MALLLETNLDGDLVIDLDLEGSPTLCRNFLKLAKARYFTSNLVFNVIQPNRFCQTGDPTGTGQGGSCIAGLLDSVDEEKSTKRFLKASSAGRELTSSIDLRKRGRVVCTELVGIPDTIGSQFSILLGHDEPGHGMDGFYTTEGEKPKIISLGQVMEDDNDVLTKLEQAYCDPAGRPYVDIRLRRVLVLHDPFEDPPELSAYLKNLADFKFEADGKTVAKSPDVSKPNRETVPERITADQLTLTNGEEDEEARLKEQENEARQQDHSRAVVLELLGDLPDAEAKAPENVLFVCKLNRETQEEDLELIFSRFDPNVNVDLIRDYETGDSLQYAFVDFSTKEQCVEAYFKMDNALVDDRRIKVDFSQSVAKLWNRHTQQKRKKKMDNAKGSTSRNFSKSLSSGTKEAGKYRSVEQKRSHLAIGDRGTRNHQHSHQPNREHFNQRHHDERHLDYRNDTRSGNSLHLRGEREGHKEHRRDRDENSRCRYDDKHYDRNIDERSRYRSRNHNDESERHRHDRYGDTYEGSHYRRKHHRHGNRHRHGSDDEEVCDRDRSLKSKGSCLHYLLLSHHAYSMTLPGL